MIEESTSGRCVRGQFWEDETVRGRKISRTGLSASGTVSNMSVSMLAWMAQFAEVSLHAVTRIEYRWATVIEYRWATVIEIRSIGDSSRPQRPSDLREGEGEGQSVQGTNRPDRQMWVGWRRGGRTQSTSDNAHVVPVDPEKERGERARVHHAQASCSSDAEIDDLVGEQTSTC